MAVSRSTTLTTLAPWKRCSEEPFDVVCCVGYRQSGRGSGVDLRFKKAGMIIGIGHDDTKLGNTFPLDIGVWGNVRPVLQALNALWKPEYAQQPHIQRRAAHLRERRAMAGAAASGRNAPARL